MSKSIAMVFIFVSAFAIVTGYKTVNAYDVAHEDNISKCKNICNVILTKMIHCKEDANCIRWEKREHFKCIMECSDN